MSNWQVVKHSQPLNVVDDYVDSDSYEYWGSIGHIDIYLEQSHTGDGRFGVFSYICTEHMGSYIALPQGLPDDTVPPDAEAVLMALYTLNEWV